jgi:HPt (histidine-containing phosphotransfer) domain-containing protein
MLARWLPAPSGETDRVPPTVVFNEGDLLRRLMGDRQLAGVVVQGFLDEAPSLLSNLRKRLDEEDANGVRSQAHTIRGASATVAAEGLHAIAEQMEMAGKAGQLDRCRELLPRAVEELQRFRSALERAGWV